MELLFDDEWIDRKAGVRRVPGPVRKEPELVLRPGAPWEEDVRGGHAVIFDDEAGKFKLWYRALTSERAERSDERDVVSSERDPAKRRTFLCYAESSDGVVWERPPLGLFDYQGNRDNNILREVDHGDSVWWNVLKDPDEPDPDRRYKSLGFTGQIKTSTIAGIAPGRKGVGVAYSPDGLHWPDRPRHIMDTEDLTDCDCILPCREPTTGKWVAFFRPRTSPKRRYIGYAESDDFDHWTCPRMLLTPDIGDPEWYEFYGLTVGCIGGWRVGGLWIYHNNPDFSPMTMELVYSRDGLTYHRPMPGEQFVPLGKTGEYDSRMVRGVGLIERGPECLIFYDGSNGTHGSDRFMEMQPGACPEGEAPIGGLALARVAAQQFCGLRADMDGLIETKWLCNYGAGGVRASIAIEDDGWVRAELLDQYGRVIPGFERDTARHTTGDDGRLDFHWGRERLNGAFGQESEAGGKVGHVVKMRFLLHRATLYGFHIGEDNLMPPYIS